MSEFQNHRLIFQAQICSALTELAPFRQPGLSRLLRYHRAVPSTSLDKIGKHMQFFKAAAILAELVGSVKNPDWSNLIGFSYQKL